MSEPKFSVYAVCENDADGLNAAHLFIGVIFISEGHIVKRWEPMPVTFRGNNPDRLRAYMAEWWAAGMEHAKGKGPHHKSKAQFVAPTTEELYAELSDRDRAASFITSADAFMAAKRKAADKPSASQIEAAAKLSEATKKAAPVKEAAQFMDADFV